MYPECELLGTLGCHLCEVAEAVLMPFVERGLLVELVDIAECEGKFKPMACASRCCAGSIQAQSWTGLLRLNRW